MKKVFSLLLSMTIVCALILSVVPAQAATSSGMEFSKTATVNSDGTIDITLEAFATGDKVITTVTRDVPTDIILVLDQSLSMTSNHLQSEPYAARVGATNETLYNVRHNGSTNPNLWYKLNDNEYVSVSVTKVEDQASIKYNPLPTSYVNYKSSGNRLIDCYYLYADQLYEEVGVNDYRKVELDEERIWVNRNWQYVYTYTFADGSTVTSTGQNRNPYTHNESSTEFQKHAPLYVPVVDSTKTVYTYTYTHNGETHTIGTSTGADTVFEPTLYELSNGQGPTCLAALKTAVTTFANGVAAKAAGPDGNLATTEDNVNHRIAVVGFGANASGTYQQNSAYRGTELFVGSTQYGYRNAADHYDEAFQNMNTQAGQDNVSASIAELTDEGYTYVNLGLEMANGILNANQLNANEERNRVIIVFTDGVPGGNTTWEEPGSRDTAEAAWEEAKKAKNAGVTVYAIGVFDEADPSSAGSWATNATQKDKANYYMQHMSSNNGSVSNPSYYLSAASSGSLTNIFKQLSDNIQSGSTTSTLTEEAVVKDLVAPQFTLPEGADAEDIIIETYKCTGKTNGQYTWTKNAGTMGAEATVVGDQVSVTGFDFVGNYVTEIKTNNEVTGYQGHKLVIKFTVEPEADFLGGNDVYTNSSAGIYENDEAEAPAVEFPRPQVNVPIDNVDVEVTAADLNVYLLEGVTLKQIKDSTTVMCGEVELKLDAENYGLDPAMLEYVNITATYTDANNNVLTDLKDLKEDTTYKVAVTVAPKVPEPVSKQGEKAVADADEDTGAINVFKPVLTFKDGKVDYNTAFPDDDTLTAGTNGGYVGVQWMHGSTPANPDTMTTTAPALNKTYTPVSGVTGEFVTSTDEVPVKVNVALGDTNVTNDATFMREACTIVGEKTGNACSWNEAKESKNNPAFVMHVEKVSGDLTINKKVVDANGTELTSDKEFDVQVTLKDANGAGVSKTYKLSDGTEVVFTNGVANVKVKPGTPVVIEEIEYGYTYEVAETSELMTGYRLKEYDAKKTGSMTAEGAETTITNYATRSMTVQKTVQGLDGIAAKESYAFELAFNSTVLGEQPFTFSLVNGETKTFENIPVGTTFSLTEKLTDAQKAKYDTPVINGTAGEALTNAKLDANAPAVYEVVNTYKTGSLTVTKTVSGDPDKVEQGQRFIFKVTGPNGYSTELVLGAGQSITLTNLPYGDYIVTEDTNWAGRYVTDTNNPQEKTVDKDHNPTAAFTNTRKTSNQWLDANAGVTNDFSENKNGTAY